MHYFSFILHVEFLHISFIFILSKNEMNLFRKVQIRIIKLKSTIQIQIYNKILFIGYLLVSPSLHLHLPLVLYQLLCIPNAFNSYSSYWKEIMSHLQLGNGLRAAQREKDSVWGRVIGGWGPEDEEQHSCRSCSYECR